MEPLRAEWETVLNTIELKKGELAAIGLNDPRRDVVFRDARNQAQAFHAKLCATRVLDPACGTGNFLYVTMELMKRLEGEVIEVVEALGGQSELAWLDRATVDPHQFLGLEINPRAAAIAELVLWLGYLQWHFRTQTDAPPEPILKAFRNIKVMDAVLQADKELACGPDGKPLRRARQDGQMVEVYRYDRPRRAEWPQSEFIIGNPPFIPNRRFREEFGAEQIAALKGAYPEFTQAADYILFFWLRALIRPSNSLRRVGFISTSRLRMQQNRKIFEKALGKDWQIIFAIPDHDWPSDTDAAVRVCFVTASLEPAKPQLVLAPDHNLVQGKSNPQSRDYVSQFVDSISADLTSDFDVNLITKLDANAGMCHAGVKPYSRKLHIDKSTREFLFGNSVMADQYAPMIFNGRDIGQHRRNLYVLDFFNASLREIERSLPRVYQYVLEHVKPERASERNVRLRTQYWLFEANREEMREGIKGLSRYICTLENSPQRYFTFLSSSCLPDQKLRVVVSSDAYYLGVLSSDIHRIFSIRIGGRAGAANTPVYNTDCFAKFPFPDSTDNQKSVISAIADDLDAHRKRVLAAHPHLTLTSLYNVLEKLKAGIAPAALEADERQTFDDGLVLILQEHHAALDAAVADAYGWSVDAPDDAILAKLVALNHERAREEQAGQVRWLRPDFQIPRFGTATDKAQLALVGGQGAGLAETTAKGGKPAFPSDDYGQMAAVMAALASAAGAMDAGTIAATFRQGQRIRDRVAATLTALVRTGWISSGDGGKSFAMRRVA